MENGQIAGIFDEIADLLELKQDNPFRIRSYRNAARTIRDLPHRLEDFAAKGGDPTELPSIGEAIAKKIHQILETGTCPRLEELRQQTPARLTTLMHVPGLGPRKTIQLYNQLGIDTLDALKKACDEHRIRDLPGMGEKTEQNILKGINTLKSAAGRFLYKVAAEHAASLGRHLDAIPAIKRWEVAGSFRRRKETIGDLDILVRADDRAKATAQILDYAGISEVTSRGEERLSVRLDSGLQIDLRFFEPQSFGSALLYFTGSKAHNIALRKRVQQRQWKLNEYGLFTGSRRLAGKTEQSIYRRLNLPWIPPELREDRGELEAAENNSLPKLIEHANIRGDLHCHTKHSDGAGSIEQMAQAARDRGYSYLGITDHSKLVTVANGLDEERLRRQADHIRKLNQSLDDFWLLAGVEVDILKDGRLDLGEKLLAGLDWVIASIHYHLDLDEKKMTDRLLAAVGSGVVHCLGHPFNRIIGKRDPLRFDVDKVFDACRRHSVFIEINAQPDRLDLPDTYCQRALEAGLSFAIGTDAHRESGLDLMPFGVAVARRGWVEKRNVINASTTKQLRKKIQAHS